MKKNKKKLYLQKRKRYLSKIIGSTQKPRLSVFKSHNHIYAQLIDDSKGHTLGFTSTLDPKLKKELTSTATQQAALKVGENIAKIAFEKNIKKVVFDRSRYKYHGRIKSVATAARIIGLEF